MHEKAIEELLKSLETIASEPELRAEYSLSVSRQPRAGQLAVRRRRSARIRRDSSPELIDVEMEDVGAGIIGSAGSARARASRSVVKGTSDAIDDNPGVVPGWFGGSEAKPRDA
ncbi:hypothetical protein FRC10_006314 [Ceratobasidium sp. 414]|nr:hypothetical protein FRC10_006314 [Ceratobasidium sp. 414]